MLFDRTQEERPSNLDDVSIVVHHEELTGAALGERSELKRKWDGITLAAHAQYVQDALDVELTHARGRQKFHHSREEVVDVCFRFGFGHHRLRAVVVL